LAGFGDLGLPMPRMGSIALMPDRPSMIGRPVLDIGGRLAVAFKLAQYETAFGRDFAKRSR
jgi:arsenate reductase-like glutaredoxin family protein